MLDVLSCVGYIRLFFMFFFFQAEDGIRDLVRSRGLGDVYKRQVYAPWDDQTPPEPEWKRMEVFRDALPQRGANDKGLSLIHI